MRTLALVDGEHYPPVTRWGIEVARARGYDDRRRVRRWIEKPSATRRRRTWRGARGAGEDQGAPPRPRSTSLRPTCADRSTSLCRNAN
jgi:hypothetical protein